MDRSRLEKISRRLERISTWLTPHPYTARQWLDGDSFRRAASVPRTPGYIRDRRGDDLRRLIENDVPELVATVREHNLRYRQGNCLYCGERLALALGPRGDLYALLPGQAGVLIQDPVCPAEESPDRKHRKGGES